MLKLPFESDIRTTSGVKYHDSQGDRTLRLIVTPCYMPLTVKLARHPDSLVTMVKQLIDCIHELRYSGDVVHGDISQGNIMHRKLSEGADHFILIDFALTAVVDDRGGSFSPWTRLGTLSFMPCDLVADMAKRARKRGPPSLPVVISEASNPGIRHCVRFDFESLFWVALWCSVCVTTPRSPHDDLDSDGMDERDGYVALWYKGEYIGIANSKQAIMNNPGEIKMAPLSPAFQHLRGWLLAFMRPFSRALGEKKNADWEYVDKESDTEEDDFWSYERGETCPCKELEALQVIAAVFQDVPSKLNSMLLYTVYS